MTTFTCQVILFDLDGTLIDSFIDADLCWSEWARSAGVPPGYDFDKLYGLRRSEIVLALLPRASPEEVAEHVERVRVAEREYTGNVTARPGALELLDGLPAGSWAIVTSNDREVAEARLRAAGLPLPDVLLGADQIERGKPDPQGLLLAAAMLGAPAAASLAIDDAPVGIDAARRAGMASIAVRFRHADTALTKANAIVSNVGCFTVQPQDGELVITVSNETEEHGAVHHLPAS
jgi:sugar-phosphatase